MTHRAGRENVRMKSRKTHWLPIAIVALTLYSMSIASPHVSALQSSDNSCLSAEESLLLDRVNTFRTLNGLPNLTASQTLTAAARHQSISMATFNYFPDD